MIIHVNGQSRDVSLALTLTELVQELKLAAERVAIELNHRVIRRGDWQQTVLSEGDRVEIVHFVGGGASPMFNIRGRNCQMSNGQCPRNEL